MAGGDGMGARASGVGFGGGTRRMDGGEVGDGADASTASPSQTISPRIDSSIRVAIP
jgi:hypothetical protein